MNAPLSPKQIEYWPLAQLKPYARNAKTHDANQVAKIATSMAEFGWTVPVLVAADGELIAGHGRILAAAHLGLAEVPVRWCQTNANSSQFPSLGNMLGRKKGRATLPERRRGPS